jgi:hypothetical protein
VALQYDLADAETDLLVVDTEYGFRTQGPHPVHR